MEILLIINAKVTATFLRQNRWISIGMKIKENDLIFMNFGLEED